MSGLIRSLKDAFSGLCYCFATQRNMVIHAMIGAVTLGLALVLRVSALELLVLFFVIFAVLAAEAFNTALERAVDIATRDENELAHQAKDAAAGAVLLISILAVLTGLFIFGPRLLRLAGLL